MHTSAMVRMNWFVQNHITPPRLQVNRKIKVLDVGAYNVNGCYRDLFASNSNVEYVGLDIEAGPNVDIVVNSPYNWDNVEDESFDFVISGNAFEHIEFPWLTIRLIYSKLKYGGFAAILAPNSTGEHNHPIDCYRYYADGFRALAKWGGFKVINVTVAGVPDPSAPKEWDEPANDTFMILIKSLEDINVEQFPRLLYERRVTSIRITEQYITQAVKLN